MKATLSFTLPEERAEFHMAIHAGDMYSALWDIQEFIRSKVKYGEHGKEARELLVEIRTRVSEEIGTLLDECN